MICWRLGVHWWVSSTSGDTLEFLDLLVDLALDLDLSTVPFCICFIFVNPAMFCQFEWIGGLPTDGLTVSKNSLWRIWNYGDTWPVSKFRTRDTDLACLGEGPRFNPKRARLFHFGIELPEASLLSNTYTGHAKEWLFLRFGSTWTPANRCK